jgi:hypothetical protein
MGNLELKSSVYLCEEEDFTVFLFYKENEISGINFHFGDQPDYRNFNKPNPHITEIYNRIMSKQEGKPEDMIIKAIKLYLNAFVWLKLK